MPLWLSHHREETLYRTYRVFGVDLCARCLGLYPSMIAALALQIGLRAPLRSAVDPLLALGLSTPALIDWVAGELWSRRGRNGIRTTTGILLGLSLGRTLYVHFHRPFPLWLNLQIAWIAAFAAPVLWRKILGSVRMK